MKVLQKRLGYEFKDETLLQRALAHRSYGKVNNERMEFLGDSILNFVIAEWLYQKFPHAVEGVLSRLRANLVRGETLAKVAQKLDVGPNLLLGVGEMRSGGESRDSILADCLEAIIAAIYFDSGIEACREKILIWFTEEIEQVSPDQVVKDPKSLLQEYLQGKQIALPEYQLVEVKGKEHKQTFVVSCKTILIKQDVLGEGTSRRRAEQDAAAKMLKELNQNG